MTGDGLPPLDHTYVSSKLSRVKLAEHLREYPESQLKLSLRRIMNLFRFLTIARCCSAIVFFLRSAACFARFCGDAVDPTVRDRSGKRKLPFSPAYREPRPKLGRLSCVEGARRLNNVGASCTESYRFTRDMARKKRDDMPGWLTDSENLVIDRWPCLDRCWRKSQRTKSLMRRLQVIDHEIKRS